MMRPCLRLHGLPYGTTDDRQVGQGTYAQVIGRLHHPQSRTEYAVRLVSDTINHRLPPRSSNVAQRYKPSKLEKGSRHGAGIDALLGGVAV